MIFKTKGLDGYVAKEEGIPGYFFHNKMSKSANKTIFYLMLWVGCVQFLHFGALIRATYYYLKTGTIGFPAPPPLSGWEPQTVYFLFGCGITDSILILLTLYFVMSFFFKGTLNITLGLLSLGSSMVTALIFAIGTIPTGAWSDHPWAYGIMSILFTPFLVLFTATKR